MSEERASPRELAEALHETFVRREELDDLRAEVADLRRLVEAIENALADYGGREHRP